LPFTWLKLAQSPTVIAIAAKGAQVWKQR